MKANLVINLKRYEGQTSAKVVAKGKRISKQLEWDSVEDILTY